MDEEEYFRKERYRMVAEQIEGRGIRTQRVLEAMRTVPRHVFVPPAYASQAYEDGPLPIGFGQTISQPYIVALMTDLLRLKGDEIVLEIGTGSGYQAAILSRLARQVYSIERQAELAALADERLRSLGYHNVRVIVGDGSGGLPEYAPYDAILVTAAAPRISSILVEQLKVNGRLVVPVGGRYGQELCLCEKLEGGLDCTEIAPVAFVPLRGEHGWKEEEWEGPEAPE